MTTKYIGPGDSVQYSNTGSAISSGDPVVLGAVGNVSVGVALTDIAATTGVGTVAITGVYTFTKATGAVIAQGETVNWDASASNVDDNAATAASGDVEDFGIAMTAAGSGVLTVDVLLLPGNGAIT